MVLTTAVLKSYSWKKNMWEGEILMNASKNDSIRKSLYVGTDQKLQHEKFKGPIIARSDALS